MNILKHKRTYLFGFIAVVISGYYLYLNTINQNEILVNKDPGIESVHIDENIIPVIPKWTTYVHPSLGYMIDYPDSYPVISFRTTTSSVSTTFSSDPAMGTGFLSVTLGKAEGETIFDHNKKRYLGSEYARIDPPTISFKNVQISDPKIEAYLVTVSGQDYSSESLQFSLGGVYYEIDFIHLTQSVIDRAIKSFSVDFIPKEIK